MARGISVGHNRSFSYLKKTIRAVLNLNFNAHTNYYCKESSILKSNELYKFNLCCHLYKILRNKNTDYFDKYFRSYSELRSLNTRNNSSLIIPKFYLTTSQNSFAYQSIKHWNCLPSTIRNRSNVQIFDFQFKKYFSSQYLLILTSAIAYCFD